MTNSKSAGFTLIELVIVIVILGVLAAVAAPRFIDLSQDAERSSLQAQASSLESASAINFAAAAASGNRSTSDSDAVLVDGCNDESLERLTDDGFDSERYDVNPANGFETGFGSRNTCTLDREGVDTTAEFTLIAVPDANGD